VSEYKHFLITRFNLKKKGWETTKNNEKIQTEEWLRHRFELFELYCLPSVINQSNQDFIWYVFFDISTPELYRKKVDAIAENYQNFRPFYIDGREGLEESVMQEMKKDIKKEEFVITSRLDNDDIIHKDFIQSIQKSFQPVSNTVIDLREGYQLILDKNRNEIREYIHPFNQFVSLIEKSRNFRTVLDQMHYSWVTSDNIVVYDKKRLWIEIVHQKNKANATKYNMPKAYGLEYKEFQLRENDFKLENRAIIALSNMILSIKLSAIKLLRSNQQIEAFAKKIKGLMS